MANKIVTKSYKFRLQTSKAINALLENTLYLCRSLYNASLQERRDAYQINRVSINYQAQQNQLPDIKNTNPEYREIHSQVLQNVLKRCERAFDGFFRRTRAKQTVGFPRFKGQSRYDSFCYPQTGFSLTGNKLRLSKFGTVKVKLSRTIQGKVKTCTIKKEINNWFVIFTVETSVEPLPKTGQSVGLDAGISAFMTLSDGTEIDNFKYYESTQKKLRVAQRSVSRRKKGSNGRRKAVLELRKFHQKIKNQRNDFQHKVSTHLVNEYDLIAIEKLSILGMARGILSKQVNDVAWNSFFQKLKYKAENADKTLIEVNSAYTSQACSQCGNIVKKDLGVRIHHCVPCGLKINRDWNAAINILRLGQETEKFPLSKVSLESLKWAVASCFDSESPSITASV